MVQPLEALIKMSGRFLIKHHTCGVTLPVLASQLATQEIAVLISMTLGFGVDAWCFKIAYTSVTVQEISVAFELSTKYGI